MKPIYTTGNRKNIYNALTIISGLALLFSSACLPMFSTFAIAETAPVPTEVPIAENPENPPCGINTASQADEANAEAAPPPDEPPALPAAAAVENPEVPPAGETQPETKGLISEPVPDTAGDSEPVIVPENRQEVLAEPPVEDVQPAAEMEIMPPEETLPTLTAAVNLLNENCATISNNTETAGTTGGNLINSGESNVVQSGIDTGEVDVYANVLNIVNTNQINSELVQIVENYNNLAADLLMNQAETTPSQLNTDIIDSLCPDISCISLSTFKLTNKNTATVENTVEAVADSGNNSITDAGNDAVIKTGSVKALVNILNIVNTNLINSRWTIATFNIFGNWEGDLVLPSELYFDGYQTAGKNETGSDLQQVHKVVLDLTNNNQATIINVTDNAGNSGSNSIVSGENISGGEIATGTVETVSNVKNLVNSTLVNTDWFLSIVNTLGDWSGNVYSLPENMSFEQTGLGVTFFSTSSKDAGLNKQFSDSLSGITGGQEITVQIENNNQAEIINDVKVKANSGNNLIEASGDASNTRVISGPVKILSNVLNFANTNLINSNLNLGIMNIFGTWNGNIVFGYPDLTVEHKLRQPYISSDLGTIIQYDIFYGNNSGSSMNGAKLRWHFDPDLLKLEETSNDYIQVEAGVAEFELGKLPASTRGSLSITMRTAEDLTGKGGIETMAKISGSGPEKQAGNNTSILISQIFKESHSFGGGTGLGGLAARSELVNVEKTNDSVSPLKSGDNVTFTIKIYNGNESKILDSVLYDVLKAPDGTVLTEEKHELGEVQPREEIDYTYILTINDKVTNGTYENSAYLIGRDGLNQPIKSKIAVSRFEVSNPVVAGETVTVAAAVPHIIKAKTKALSPSKNESSLAEALPIPAETAYADGEGFDLRGGTATNNNSGSVGWLLFWVLLIALCYEIVMILLARKKKEKAKLN